MMQLILDYERMSEQKHSFSLRVSFGDCDPAGIAYYPNILGWLDRAFHDWLWEFGGHDALCERVGALGIGLMDVSARFLKPLRNGDRLIVEMSVEEWGEKALRLAYKLRSGESLMARGCETRGLFAQGAAGMMAARLDPLRRILEGHEK
jgi:4-hydroxybenzoyl-CoA thioesterase